MQHEVNEVAVAKFLTVGAARRLHNQTNEIFELDILCRAAACLEDFDRGGLIQAHLVPKEVVHSLF